jgi:hypothetical protein
LIGESAVKSIGDRPRHEQMPTENGFQTAFIATQSAAPTGTTITAWMLFLQISVCG